MLSLVLCWVVCTDWSSLRTAERCQILVDTGIPELECFGLQVSVCELQDLPLLASSVVEAVWEAAHACDRNFVCDC